MAGVVVASGCEPLIVRGKWPPLTMKRCFKHNTITPPTDW